MSTRSTSERVSHIWAESFGFVSRGLLILLLVPIVAAYPVVYFLNDDEELEDKYADTALDFVPRFSPLSVGPAFLYSIAFLAVVVGFSWMAVQRNYFSSVVMFGALLGLTFYLGVASAFQLHRWGFERDLAKRIFLSSLLGASIAVVLVLTFWYRSGTVMIDEILFYIEQPTISVVPIAATLTGAVSGNGYIVKSDAITQRKKRRGEDVDSESLVHTKRYKGSEVSDGKGETLVENLTENKWVVPDDLDKRATIKKTRNIDTYKDITRVLQLNRERFEKTIPNTKFRDEKSKHRTDYRSREDVAPSGFSSATYTFYVPGSKETSSCGNCAGRGHLDCGSCGSRGSVDCGNCGGAGRLRCGNCRGDGQVTVDEKCGVCRGSGEDANGWTCNNCSGYGSIEKTMSCPECGNGKVRCSNCGGDGKVTCADCGGNGRHSCGTCDGCGELTSFEYVKRSYQPHTGHEFRNNSVPISVIQNAKGKQISKETDEDPVSSNHYRRQEETRKIPVTSTIYEYLGDEWELFGVEGSVKHLDHPRDFDKQFRVIQGVGVVSVAVLSLASYYPI